MNAKRLVLSFIEEEMVGEALEGVFKLCADSSNFRWYSFLINSTSLENRLICRTVFQAVLPAWVTLRDAFDFLFKCNSNGELLIYRLVLILRAAQERWVASSKKAHKSG